MSDAPVPAVSVVIRCFNEVRHIGRLLEALGRQHLRPTEVIVVDSGSTDGTLDVVRAHGARLVQIAPGEFTFGRSLNLGCRAATGEILVFASAHVLPLNDAWLSALVRPFGDSRVGLVYGRQVGTAETSFSEHQVFEKHFPPQSVADQDGPFCNNANCAVRRSLWARHPYDETLTGLEDLAWGQWARREGLRIVYSAEAAIHHIHEETARQVMRRYRREAIALRSIYPDSHMSLIEMVAFLLHSVAIDVRAAARAGRLPGVLAQILWYRLMQYLGTYLGLHQRSAVTREMIMQYYYPKHYPASVAAPARPATAEPDKSPQATP